MMNIIETNNASNDLLDKPNHFSAGESIEWLKQAWNLFKNDFVIWLVMMLAWIAIAFFANWVPFVGSLAVAVMTPAVLAGFYYAAHQAYSGRKVQFEDIFYGLQNKLQPLIILGLIQLGFYIAIGLLVALTVGIGGFAMIASAASDSATGMLMSLVMGAIGTILVMVGSIPFAMAMWYAPILVMFHDLPPVEALKRSFFACLKNWLTWLIFLIVMMILFALSVLTLGLGALLLAALCVITVYISYRAVFFNPS